MRQAYPVFYRNGLCFIPDTYEYITGTNIADVMNEARQRIEKQSGISDPMDVDDARQLAIEANPLFDQSTLLYIDVEKMPGVKTVTLTKPVGGRPARPVPNGFEQELKTNTQASLRKKYGVSRSVIDRWKRELANRAI